MWPPERLARVEMSKRFLINILLLAIFGAILSLLTAPLLAELTYRTAQRATWEEDWPLAESGFARATGLIPISAEYHLGYGDYLWTVAESTGDARLLEHIHTQYSRAVELNSACAECWIKRGRISLAAGDAKSAIEDFHAAHRLDPRGGDTAFMLHDAARALLEANLDHLDEVFKLDQDYATSFAGTAMIAQIFRDRLLGIPDEDLLAELKNRLQQYEGARDVVQPDQWLGISLDGQISFTDGRLTAAGTVDALINLSKRKSTLTIRARGTPANGVPPFVLMELDGQLIAHRFVDATEWRDYTFDINHPVGPKVLSITFANGSATMPADRSRQLHIERAWIR